MKKYLLLTLLSFTLIGMSYSQTEDPYLWLEEVNGTKALEFVNQHNTTTLEKLSKEKPYQSIYDKSLEIYNSTDRIIYPSLYPGYVYNFWQDKDHVRGIWRRSPQDDYLNGNPKWQILLDIDEMSKKDNVQWV